MTDLLQQLRDANPEPLDETVPSNELRARVLRSAASTPASKAPRSRRLLLGAALAVACGGGVATAAVLSLSGEPSKPSSGTITGAQAGEADRYGIRVLPDLKLGANGWCVTVGTAVASERATTSVNCAQVPRSGALLVGGGLASVSSTRALSFFLVDERVAAARLHDGRIVRSTFASDLPPGVRLIAAMVPAHGYHADEHYLAARLLDANGGALASDESDLTEIYSDPSPPVAASSGSAGSPCALSSRPDSGLSQVRAVRRSSFHAVGPAFFSCATAVVHVDNTPIDLSVLAAPKGAPVTLPGARSTGDAPDLADDTSARRIRDGWLVAHGGTAAQRHRVLADVSATIQVPRDFGA